MHLYKITNLVNGKKYIGITLRKDPRRRWTEHKCTARNNRSQNLPIVRALRKHGDSNFRFEVLKSFENIFIEDLLKLESDLILRENTLTPNGYNLQLHSEYRIHTKELSKRISNSQQGTKRKTGSSNFLGVYKQRDTFYFETKFENKKITRSCGKNELLAAKSYDMAVLYYFGRTARTNFPESNYSDEQISDFLINLKRKPSKCTSSHKGIYFDKHRKCFRVRFKGRYIGQAKTEIEAKKLYNDHVLSLQYKK